MFFLGLTVCVIMGDLIPLLGGVVRSAGVVNYAVQLHRRKTTPPFGHPSEGGEFCRGDRPLLYHMISTLKITLHPLSFCIIPQRETKVTH